MEMDGKKEKKDSSQFSTTVVGSTGDNTLLFVPIEAIHRDKCIFKSLSKLRLFKLSFGYIKVVFYIFSLSNSFSILSGSRIWEACIQNFIRYKNHFQHKF